MPFPHTQSPRRCLAFLVVSIVLNGLIGVPMQRSGLPLYLDMAGTVFMAVACGPFWGMLSGGASTLFFSLFRPEAWIWFPVAMSVGAMAGLCARWKFFISPTFSVLAGFFIAITASITSLPIRMYVDLQNGVGETLISSPLVEAGKEALTTIISTTFMVEMVDKVSICLMAWVLLRLIPPAWLEERRVYLYGKPGLYHPPATTVVSGYLALLVLYATFFVTMILAPGSAGADPAAHEAIQAVPVPLFEQVCVHLAHYGHWLALTLVGITFVGTIYEA